MRVRSGNKFVRCFFFIYIHYLKIHYKRLKMDFQSAEGRVSCWVWKLSERSFEFLLVMKIYVSPIMFSSFLCAIETVWILSIFTYFLFHVDFINVGIGNFVAMLLLASVDNRPFPVFAFVYVVLLKSFRLIQVTLILVIFL